MASSGPPKAPIPPPRPAPKSGAPDSGVPPLPYSRVLMGFMRGAALITLAAGGSLRGFGSDAGLGIRAIFYLLRRCHAGFGSELIGLIRQAMLGEFPLLPVLTLSRPARPLLGWGVFLRLRRPDV